MRENELNLSDRQSVGACAKPLLTAAGICVFRVIWMFGVVPRFPEMRTITLSYPISWTLTTLAFLIYYPRARRRLGFTKWTFPWTK